MKHRKLFLILIAAFSLLTINSCLKETYTYNGPRIEIYGDNPLYINVGDHWRDFVPKPQAHAYDDLYGIVDFFYRDHVDNETVGKYTVEYVAIDVAGFETTKDRIVYVQNESNFLDGNYNVTNSFEGNTYSFISDVTSSGSTNNRIYFSQFTNTSEGAVTGDVINKNQIVIPQQTVGKYTYFGQGTISNVDKKVSIVINYTEIINGKSYQGVSSFQKIDTSTIP
ncbi:MAG: immunoglobulin-like domain-containing protein [Bacteroidales bacterium]